MKLKLLRYSFHVEHTHGMAFIESDNALEFICYTLERGNQNNQPGVSCIPPGEYLMAPHRRPNADWVYIVTGGTVCKYPHQVDEEQTRCLILWHAGNKPEDSQGCILPGQGAAPGFVRNSRDAMAGLKRKLSPYFSMNPQLPMTIQELR